MPPLPPAATAHITAPVGAGGVADPDAYGEAGGAECGDLVRIELSVHDGVIREIGFRANGCPAATAAASAACARLAGAPVDAALSLTPAALDAALGGLRPAHRHGPDLVVEAVARALERWFSDRLGDAVPARAATGRVAVAMSGGVDSAVAALLLHEAGFDVIGVTMRLWHDPAATLAERSCCAPETVRLARASAHTIGVPHLTLDVAERFRRVVVDDFVSGYAAGRTPNPCVTCNGEARFSILADAAALLGAHWLASGHYARIDRSGPEPAVARARDRGKDQSYMLARLPAELLARMRFPLGELTKDEVRARARAAAMPAADAVESQEICFVGADGYAPFLERAGLAARRGAILDEAGTVLGEHSGHWRFTVGQRRGLGLSGPAPRYVTRIDAEHNTVTVGPPESLAVTRLGLERVVVREDIGHEPLEIRVRYRGASVDGVARPDGPGRLVVDLAEPARGVAPGQTAALYRDDRLVAAGSIAEYPRSSETEVP